MQHHRTTSTLLSTPMLLKLPHELLEKIFQYLGVSDKKNLRLMCRHLENTLFNWFVKLAAASLRFHGGRVFYHLDMRGQRKLVDLSKLEKPRLQVKQILVIKMTFHPLDTNCITEAVSCFPNLSTIRMGYYGEFMRAYRPMNRLDSADPEPELEEFGYESHLRTGYQRPGLPLEKRQSDALSQLTHAILQGVACSHAILEDMVIGPFDGFYISTGTASIWAFDLPINRIPSLIYSMSHLRSLELSLSDDGSPNRPQERAASLLKDVILASSALETLQLSAGPRTAFDPEVISSVLREWTSTKLCTFHLHDFVISKASDLKSFLTRHASTLMDLKLTTISVIAEEQTPGWKAIFQTLLSLDTLSGLEVGNLFELKRTEYFSITFPFSERIDPLHRIWVHEGYHHLVGQRHRRLLLEITAPDMVKEALLQQMVGEHASRKSFYVAEDMKVHGLPGKMAAFARKYIRESPLAANASTPHPASNLPRRFDELWLGPDLYIAPVDRFDGGYGSEYGEDEGSQDAFGALDMD